MTYFITPVLGLTLPNPGTGQTFETPVVNNDFVLLENGIAADRTRLTNVETRATTLEGKPSFRSTAAFYNVANAAGRAAISGQQPGDSCIQRDTGHVRQWNGTAWLHTSALVPIIPTAAGSFSGGAVSIEPNGRILVSGACTGVGVNGCFTSEFDNYLVITSRVNKSAGVDMQMRLRVGGVADTSANYFTRRVINAGLTPTQYSSVGAASFVVDGGASNSATDTEIDVFDPFPVIATRMLLRGGLGWVNPATDFNGGGSHGVNASYDGFDFFPASGTFIGQIKIFARTMS